MYSLYIPLDACGHIEVTSAMTPPVRLPAQDAGPARCGSDDE